MKLKTLVAALLVGAFFSSAHALNNTPAASPAGAGYRITFGSNGTPLISSGTPSVSAGSTTGEALIRDLFKAPGPGGKTLDLAAARSIPWGTVARTAARASGYLAAGMLLYDLYDKYRVKPGQGGFTGDMGQPMQDFDGWSCADPGNSSASFFGKTATAACAMLAASPGYNKTTFDGTYYRTTSTTINGCTTNAYGTRCEFTTVTTVKFASGATASNPSSYTWGTPAAPSRSKMCPAIPGTTNPLYKEPGGPVGPDGLCPTEVYTPLTEAEAEKIVQEKGDKTKAADYVRELLQKDVKFEPAPTPQLSGPPKVSEAPRVTTQTDAQGNVKQTTVTDVHNITYQGDSYTWNTTTITNNPDGSTIEAPKEEPEQVTPPADPALPDVPKLYTQKYPNGPAGVWNDNAAAIQQTPIFRFLATLNPNLSNGGCPTWSLNAGDVLGIQVGGDISVPCYVWSFLRVFFVICALLAARRLIFGG